MEADDRQMTTVFTVQPSFHHRTLQTEYHEALLSSANVQSHLNSSFTNYGNGIVGLSSADGGMTVGL